MSVINDSNNSNFYKICERMKHLMAVVAARSRYLNVTETGGLWALGFTRRNISSGGSSSCRGHSRMLQLSVTNIEKGKAEIMFPEKVMYKTRREWSR